VVAGSAAQGRIRTALRLRRRRSQPLPVVEFIDTMTAGQFWPTTMVEQLIGIQREYNDLRNKISNS
jgi:hypothetical protein